MLERMRTSSVRAAAIAALVWASACGDSGRVALLTSEADPRAKSSGAAGDAARAGASPSLPPEPGGGPRENICVGPPPTRDMETSRKWDAVNGDAVQAMQIRRMGEITAARRI